jgi:putative restriction endonuclease
MVEYLWTEEVRKWIDKRKDSTPELAEEYVRFFRQAFEHTHYPQQAWFGAHSGTLSLVVGGIFLAAVVSAGDEKGIWLLVDQSPPSIIGLAYSPVKSTQGSITPLVWAHAWPFDKVSLYNESTELWLSYSQASEKIFNSPISAERDRQQLARGKKRLKDFWTS